MRTTFSKILLLCLVALTTISVKAQNQVTVTSTGGTSPVNYSTLSAAFGAINAGTHTGAIGVSINQSTTEPAGKSDTLYSSGSGSANYSSVTISPSAAGVVVSGSPVTGRGVIELFGADNVTIDGHWSGSSNASSRDLTITATTSVITTFCSAIRLATSTANPNLASCDNNTIKNCIVNGNVYGTPGVATASNAGDTSTITSTASSTASSFNIVIGSGGTSTVINAVTSTGPTMSSVTATGGTLPPTVNNLVVLNNQVNQAGRGIGYFGFGGNSSNSVTIKNNVVGSSTDISSYTIKKTGSPVQLSVVSRSVYVKGIIVAGASNYYIDSNTIQNMASFIATPMSGIELLSVYQANTSGTYRVQGNTVKNLYLVAAANTYGILNNTGSTSGALVTINGNNFSNLQAANGNSAIGIALSSSTTGATVSNNTVTKVWNVDSTATSQAVGIQLSTAANYCKIFNNSVSNILTNLCSSTASFNVSASTGGIFGIQIAATSNTGGYIYNNSVYLSGTTLGSTTINAHITAAFAISGTSDINFDVRNNIFANTISGGATCAHVSIYLPTAATSAMNLVLNNNAYYCGNSTSQGLAQVGNTQGVGLYSAANFSAGPAAPTTTNFRYYTNNLNNLGTNDNASFASTASVPFVSTNDLHINTATQTSASQIESGGVSTTVTNVLTDIESNTRSTAYPDLGAYEFNGIANDITAPIISYTALGFDCNPTNLTSKVLSNVTITDYSGVPVTGSIVPRIYYKKGVNGTYNSNAGTYNGSTWSFSINYTGLGLANGDSVYYFIVAQDNAGNVGTYPGGGVFSSVNSATTYPTAAWYRTASLSGNYNIGAGYTGNGFTTLSAAIKAYNNSCIDGAVTFSLINSSYTTTSDTILANATASATNTLTIKPTLANTVITGNSGAKNGVIVFYGADYVTINGSISNNSNSICSPTSRASRDLTIINSYSSSTTTGAVIWLCNTVSNDGATNNKIINCNITGTYNSTFGGYTQVGIGCGGPNNQTANSELIPKPSGAATNYGYGNNNNQYINDSISVCSFGIHSLGASTSNKNTGTVINMNVTAKSPNNVQRCGISTGFEDGININGNTINALDMSLISSSTNAMFGINLGFHISNTAASVTTVSGDDVTNATVTKNVLDSVYNTAASPGGGAALVGIFMLTGSTGTSTIANNRISNYTAMAGFGGTDLTSALHVCGGTGTVNVYNNTINLVNGTIVTNGFTGTEACYGISIGNISPTVNLKNNIVNASAAVWTNKNRALGLGYALPATNLTSNNNDFFASVGTGTTASTNAAAIAQVGSLLSSSGTVYTTLSAWQTASGTDANSLSFAPVFKSANNLHIDPSNATNCSLKGAAISGLVADDIDCAARLSNDIGADEIMPAVTISATATTICSGANVTFTANTSNNESFTYQWKVNGAAAGTNSGTFSTNSLSNNDAVSCSVSSNSSYTSCFNGTASSNSIVMTVNPNVTPSVSISTPSTTVCSGNSVTFTATGNNTGNAPVYQWKKNGTNVTMGNSVTFAANSLATNDVISCVLTANNTCQTVVTANSNNIVLTVKQSPVAATILSEFSNNTSALTLCSIGKIVALYPSVTNGVWSSSNAGVAGVVNGGASTSTANVTALSNGTATISYTLTTPNTNCTTATVVNVIVAQQSAPASITGATSLCVGNSATYTTTSTGGIWSTAGRANINNAGVATATSAGATVIKYTLINANGCSAAASLSVTVNAQPATPSIAFAPGTTNVSGAGGYCKNRTFTLTGNPAGGVWNSTGVISITSGGLVNTGNSNGVFGVSYTITNANGCSSSRLITGNIVTCASKGIATNNQTNTEGLQMVVYPNPVKQVLKVDAKNCTDLIIVNVLGKQVINKKVSSDNETINVEQLPVGTYLITGIMKDGTRKNQKFIKE